MANLLKRIGNKLYNAFTLSGDAPSHFEAASNNRRLKNFNPPRNHINRAIEQAGDTLTSRSRWLYDNEAIYGSAVDEWVSAAISDGIKPYPRINGHKQEKQALLDLWWQWADEADYDAEADYYGIQATVAREVFLTGECFIRKHIVDFGEGSGIPLQLEVYPSEMLDVSYDAPAEIEGNYIRMGIEFTPDGRRVAYHFWRWHPYDDRPNSIVAITSEDRVRIPADKIIHIKERRQAGQLRGAPKISRSLIKLFQLETYDDAELERKKTSALFTAFLVGKGDNPFNSDIDDEDDDEPLPEMSPGAFIDIGTQRDVRFSNPTEVGGSYEPFQYRNLLKICAGLNMPYSVVTGDVTRGNFSNVRTSIIQFRRQVKQWRGNVIAFQLNRIIWKDFVEMAVLSGVVDLPDYYENPLKWHQCESFAPPLEMIEPTKDIAAEKEEIRAGLKTRTMALNERGYDREDIDREIEDERKEATERHLQFDTDIANGAQTSALAPSPSQADEYEGNQGSEAHSDGS